VQNVQIRLQKEIERLEKENRELRKNMILRDQKSSGKRKMKVCVRGVLCTAPSLVFFDHTFAQLFPIENHGNFAGRYLEFWNHHSHHTFTDSRTNRSTYFRSSPPVTVPVLPLGGASGFPLTPNMSLILGNMSAV